ncbi:MAG: DNA mismatch repair protein MutS [Deltaproteobacteria bacterium]|nr:DNA mismatch repair protein MutS [Deltaproteobacteria bacterium]
MSNLTPMMQQYLDIKRNYQDAILFYRMGDFYEMFYDDATLASKILGITLTTRDKGKKDPIPMCGVPVKSASTYISKLIHTGEKVAICEQEEGPEDTKGLVSRDVVQVITPGLLIDDDHLPKERANYLMAVCKGKTGFGIAFVDISTGDFRVTEVLSYQDFVNEVGRVSPSEILVMHKEIIPDGFYVTEIDEDLDYEKASSIVSSHFKTLGIEGIGLEGYTYAGIASGMVLKYVNNTQKGILKHITNLKYYNPGKYMILDANTKRNLEIFEPLAQGATKSLFKVINNTITAMGARRLYDWLAFPLMDPNDINKRLDALQEIAGHMDIMDSIRGALKGVFDMERIIGRISADRASPRDVLALSQGLDAVPKIREMISNMKSHVLRDLYINLDPMDEISTRIKATIIPDPPYRISDGDVIADGIDNELDGLRTIKKDSRKWIASLEAAERASTGINSLRIGYNKIFGYYIEITNANLSRVPNTYIRRQTLSNTERFITPELKDYEARLLGAQDAIKNIEIRIFNELRDYITSHISELQQRIDCLATIDALQSLAWTSIYNGYTRPEVYIDRGIEIRAGRHPVVERVLKDGEFVPNDEVFDGKTDTVHLITGPNMAGKSTFMRQIALITIMAQMGSFVPAKKAIIGLADRIFTRIGALDNLAEGKSTFLIEMSETANILNNATSSSLVILDEIGRGTSTYDGMSIAWAVAEYLDERMIRTFFATHYHELADLARRHKGIKNFHIAVEDDGSNVIFLRELRRGAIGKSYGIHVAKLAGVPSDVIDSAGTILASLGRKGRPIPKTQYKDRPVQLGLFGTQDTSIIEKISNLDLDHMKPIDALKFLYSLKGMLDKKS